ncbi:hypothetical protein AST05_06825 [Staphylococcus equorum]|nr:hypothetical protein AST05_06825 [Staphylococcus equorum]
MKNKFLKFSTVFLASTILLQPLTMSSAQVKSATTEKIMTNKRKKSILSIKKHGLKQLMKCQIVILKTHQLNKN